MIEILKSIPFLLPVVFLLLVNLKSKKAINEKLEKLISLTKVGIFLNFTAAIVAIGFVVSNGLTEIKIFNFESFGFTLRLDSLSVIMYTMVAIIAFVVLRFSFNYLDGDERQGVFIGRLATTIVAVQLMVLSGNIFMLFLAWVATSITLHKLLNFYHDRKKSRLGARKKFIVSRLGDVALLAAVIILHQVFQTGNLEEIFSAIKTGTVTDTSSLEVVGILLVVTAALKSAQLPLHGWLIDVMEAPTPVSALLHAGLLNAGPFLIIRFAYVMDATVVAPIVLFVLAGVTALYGSLVFSTQPTIKNSLAYSSIAHMGFSLMVCGLGIYSAALLHLVAHSFYKAHAFLSSGSVIDRVRTKNTANFIRKGSIGRMSLGIIAAAVIFASISWVFGFQESHEFQLWIIGGVIFIGIVNLLINAFDSNNASQSILRIVGSAISVLVSFFSLEFIVRITLESQLPEVTEPSSLMKYISLGMLSLFYIVALGFSLSTSDNNKLFRGLKVHLRNGFYLNVLFNRLVGSLRS
jgi:NAD(P)H-quinone oxidoreductase subunit 5